MRRLSVLFDQRCRACRQFRFWLTDQPAFVPLDLVPARSKEAARSFPTLVAAGEAHADLVVVGDRGEVWRGPKAWRMCLWALKGHRETSLSARLSAGAEWEHNRARHEAAAPPIGRVRARRAVPSGVYERFNAVGSVAGSIVSALAAGIFWLLVIPVALILLLLVVHALSGLDPTGWAVVVGIGFLLLVWPLGRRRRAS